MAYFWFRIICNTNAVTIIRSTTFLIQISVNELNIFTHKKKTEYKTAQHDKTQKKRTQKQAKASSYLAREALALLSFAENMIVRPWSSHLRRVRINAVDGCIYILAPRRTSNVHVRFCCCSCGLFFFLSIVSVASPRSYKRRAYRVENQLNSCRAHGMSQNFVFVCEALKRRGT